MSKEDGSLADRMRRAISTKRSIGGWLFLLVFGVFRLSDKWDSINSLYEKLKKMGPSYKFVVDAAQSSLVQLSVLIAGVIWIGLAAFYSAKRTLVITEAERREIQEQRQRLLEQVQPASAPITQTIPTEDFSNPAYDYFWQTPEERIRARFDPLIKSGQLLVERWTARLDYPEKQRRENESRNWLCEADQFAANNLTPQQLEEFTSSHGNAASGSKKYDFVMALRQAGTEAGDEDGNLAFEIFGKVKLLEKFRSKPTLPS